MSIILIYFQIFNFKINLFNNLSIHFNILLWIFHLIITLFLNKFLNNNNKISTKIKKIFYVIISIIILLFQLLYFKSLLNLSLLITLLISLQIIDYQLFINYIFNKIKYNIYKIIFSYIKIVLLTYLYFKTVILIYSLPTINIGIDDIINFEFKEYLSIIFIILVSYYYFNIYNKILNIYLKFHKSETNIFEKTYTLSAIILISLVMTIGSGKGWLWVSMANGLFFYLVVAFKLPNTLDRIRYITYFYLFIFIVFETSVISTCIYKVEYYKRTSQAKRLSTIVSRNQPDKDQIYISEFMDTVAKKMTLKLLKMPEDSLLEIDNDLFIKSYKEIFDRYEIKKYYFDKYGKNIFNQLGKNFYTIDKNFKKPFLKTKYKNLYKIDINLPGFFATRAIKDSLNFNQGWMMYEFKLRKIIPNSIFNISNRVKKNENNYDYSYGLYLNDVLYSSSMIDISMLKTFEILSEETKLNFKNGKVINDKYYYISKTSEIENVLICLNSYNFLSFISNYSFYFTILFFVLSLYILFNTLYYKFKQISTTLSTKIQLFVHLSFFLPLIICSVSVFIIINYLYKTDMEEDYIENSKKVTTYLYENFASSDNIDLTLLQQKIDQVSEILQLDISVFSEKGNLLNSTLLELYDKGNLSKTMSLEVLSSIVKQSENTIITNEKFGEIDFKNVYHPIKSYKDGKLLAIVSVPFYNSNIELTKKIIYVLKTVLNVFCVVFILFLCVTFFISRFLTIPLVMLTERIKSVSLDDNNLPLNYIGDDEIGILVNEYNQMLIKLNQNKELLANNQKELAWNEMARQVAHEIKNPLTPMKLSLQSMVRKLNYNKDFEIIQSTSEMVLSQIDVLNEIANSFSTFSKMPQLNLQIIDLKNEIKNTINLYSYYENITINFESLEDNFHINADQNLINRILINLILNAIESTESNLNPKIEINLKEDRNYITVSISDNGNGILPINYSKVFQPNFSTKSTGSGIGLAVVKKGIEQMDGTIWFESKINIGTTFYISFQKSN